VQNIGHDGTGVHSGLEKTYQVKMAKKQVKKFPDELIENEQANKAITAFLKNRKGSLLSRGIRFVKELQLKYFSKK
jgi:hypothetical protein